MRWVRAVAIVMREGGCGYLRRVVFPLVLEFQHACAWGPGLDLLRRQMGGAEELGWRDVTSRNYREVADVNFP